MVAELRRHVAELRFLGKLPDDWLRPAAVAALFDEHVAGRANHGKKLWALLMLGVWIEQRVGVSTG